jgi:hypothetical protein
MTEFAESLRKAGYVEGKNLSIDFRGAGVADNRLDAVAGRLVAHKIDVNVTGVSIPLRELVTKQVQLLTEVVPTLSSLTILANPNHPGHRRARPLPEKRCNRSGARLTS